MTNWMEGACFVLLCCDVSIQSSLEGYLSTMSSKELQLIPLIGSNHDRLTDIPDCATLSGLEV